MGERYFILKQQQTSPVQLLAKSTRLHNVVLSSIHQWGEKKKSTQICCRYRNIHHLKNYQLFYKETVFLERQKIFGLVRFVFGFFFLLFSAFFPHFTKAYYLNQAFGICTGDQRNESTASVRLKFLKSSAKLNLTKPVCHKAAPA